MNEKKLSIKQRTKRELDSLVKKTNKILECTMKTLISDEKIKNDLQEIIEENKSILGFFVGMELPPEELIR